MGDILKFVAYLFLTVLILVFAIPLLWLVIHLFIWLFGGLLTFLGSSIWLVVLVVSVIVIIFACNS
jgi:hypothetical protein